MMTRDQVYNSALEYFSGDKLAADVWVDKYAMKDKEGVYYESTPDDMHHRIAKELSRIENKYKNPISEEKIYELLKGFKYVVPQGSPMAGIGNDFVLISLSNCFVIGSNKDSDSYGSIMRTDEEQAQIMKRRGGVGHDLSHLRPNGSLANNSVLKGLAGSVAYAERYSNTTKEVSQGGRRGALMLTMNIGHPDAENFIDSKLDLSKITGANISVKITDEFMKAVYGDEDFVQTFPVDLHPADSCLVGFNEDFEYLEYNKLYSLGGGCYAKKVKARKIWDKIIKNAWKSAEPGVLFWDKIQSESPADVYGKGWETISTNPCFTGDTIVAVADGRNGVTIKELVESGDKFLVYSARKNKSTGNHGDGWKAEIKSAIAFKTGNKKVIEVKLSDGSSFKCTPDHKLALPDKTYVEAKDSIGLRLEKFYSFYNKNNEKSYRHINTKTNEYCRQYRMIWEYFNGKYDGKFFNVDHIDDNFKNDKIENLQLLNLKEHKEKTKRFGADNPIHKITNSEYFKFLQKRKNILANSSKYCWSEEKIENKLFEFDLKYGKFIEELKPEDINVDFSEDIFVEEIVEMGFEDVYDLNVEDNHNFYILTKTDDDKYLNSSGVLVHNCGELPLCEYDSCRLLLLNLYSYVKDPFTNKASFDFELLSEHSYIAQKLMDDIIDLEIEKIDSILYKISLDPEADDIKSVESSLWKRIRDKAVRGRRTGLGVTAEGDALVALGLQYGGDESIKFAEEIHKTISVNSYKSSIDMADERGSIPMFDPELEKNSLFIDRILKELPKNYVEKYMKVGRRNIANLTIAPAGSVSILTQTTSGIEPVFQVYYKRRKRATIKERVTFIDENGEWFEDYIVFHHKFVDWYEKNWYKTDSKLFDIDFHKPLEQYKEEELKVLISKSPFYKSTSEDIEWVNKVKLQGVVQKWVDHSISATTNIPEKTSVSTVSDIYLTAYESGCKGMTIYRDGSRSGVLVSADEKDEIKYIDAVKRPKELVCDIYHKTALKKDWTILVGLHKGKPYEIFAFPVVDNTSFPSRLTKGSIIKVKSKTYKLVGKDGDKVYELPNIIDLIDITGQVDTRKYSLMLRHHIDPKWIIREIEEFANITSFDKVIQRVLRNYSEAVQVLCEVCGSPMKIENGCHTCTNCSYSKCD